PPGGTPPRPGARRCRAGRGHRRPRLAHPRSGRPGRGAAAALRASSAVVALVGDAAVLVEVEERGPRQVVPPAAGGGVGHGPLDGQTALFGVLDHALGDDLEVVLPPEVVL